MKEEIEKIEAIARMVETNTEARAVHIQQALADLKEIGRLHRRTLIKVWLFGVTVGLIVARLIGWW